MDDSLENKFRLATIAPLDRRMKRKHLAVYGFILDWYHRKYGDALASVRHIVATLKERDPDGIGLYTGDVHSALKDLVSWGYLTQEKGSGRRASRYVPDWAHGRSVHKTPNTTESEISVLENQNTSVRGIPNATADSVHKTQNQDPSTVTRSLDPGTRKDGYDCAPPSAPPVPGLGGRSGADGAQGGFEELWKTYFPKRGQGDKKKARAAYEKLAPDTHLQASLLEAASAWLDAWVAQGRPDAPRKHLDTWLTGEHYDCDPPSAFKSKEKKASAPVMKSKAGTADVLSIGPRTVDIFQSDVDDSVRGQKLLKLHFSDREQPKTWEHVIVLEHPDQKLQDEGQREFAQLCNALGISSINDSSELHLPVCLTLSAKGGLEYLPAPGNDNFSEVA